MDAAAKRLPDYTVYTHRHTQSTRIAARPATGEIRRSWQGYFGTMYHDRFVVERRDFLNGMQLAPDWTIPLPGPDGLTWGRTQIPLGERPSARWQKAK